MLSPNDDLDEYRKKQEEIRKRKKRRGKKDFDSGIFGFINASPPQGGTPESGGVGGKYYPYDLTIPFTQKLKGTESETRRASGCGGYMQQLVEQKLLMLNIEKVPCLALQEKRISMS